MASTPQIFSPDSYAWLWPSDAHGAAKLSGSFVAPLVAAARGYRSVRPSDLKDTAQALLMGSLNTTRGRQLKMAVGIEDALLMPWYSAAEVAQAAALSIRPSRTSYQLRPCTPIVNKDGKSAKYVFPYGGPTVLDVHPVTPSSWFSGSRTILLAEGLLKADSALTAQLLASGASPKELMDDHGGSVEQARAALATLMLTVAAPVLIIAFAGAGNWHGHPDWNTLNFRDTTALIGLDGDVATNPNVWREAEKMVNFLESSKKSESVGLLVVPPVNGDTHAGLDDYFAAGGLWSDLADMVGTLPIKPLESSDMESPDLADVDLDGGLTSETYVVEDMEMGKRFGVRVLAEAAVTVERILTSREAVDGLWGEHTIGGVVAWRARLSGTDYKVRSMSFDNVPLSKLVGRAATPAEFLAAATGGRAAGALVANGRFSDVLGAWGESISRAVPVTKVNSSGLWEHEGKLGWLTNPGLVTSDGIDPTVRSQINHLPAITMPHVPLGEDGTMDAITSAKTIRAFEELLMAGDVFDKSQAGLWPVMIGMNVSIAANDVQAKGTTALFGTHGFGKTNVLSLSSGWNGPAWLATTAIKLKGTQAALLKQADSGNNLVFPLDDARDDDALSENFGGSSQFRIIRTVVDAYIRMGYEPELLKSTSVKDRNGKWVAPPPRENARRSCVVSGEDLESLGLNASTVQRLLSFEINSHTPLLRGQGEIVPASERLRATGAQSYLKGVIVAERLHWAQSANAAAPDVSLRDAYRQPGLADTKVAKERLKIIIPAATERDLEFLAPVVGGLISLTSTVKHAAEAVGDVAAGTKAAMWLETSLVDVATAWERHRERFGNASERPWDRYVNTIEELVARGIASFSPHAGEKYIGQRKTGPAGHRGDVALLPDAVVEMLRRTSRTVSKEQLKAAFKQAIKNDRFSMRLETTVTKGWLIDGEKWYAQIAEDTAREIAAGLEQQVEGRVVGTAPAVPQNPIASEVDDFAPQGYTPDPDDFAPDEYVPDNLLAESVTTLPSGAVENHYPNLTHPCNAHEFASSTEMVACGACQSFSFTAVSA